MPPVARHPVGFGRSLLFRMVVGVLTIVATMSAIMFVGIDFFVSSQFRRVHEARVAQQAEEVRRFLGRELAGLSALAQLIARDSDVNHSLVYHLILGGEGRAVEGDADRLAVTFHLDALSIWDLDGAAVVQRGLPLRAPTTVETVGEVRASAEWLQDRLWLVASAPVFHNGDVLARVHVGKPIDPALHGAALFGPGTHVKLASAATPVNAEAFRIPVSAANRRDLELEVVVPGLVNQALSQTKGLVAATMLIIGLLLAGAILLYLRRELRPVHALTLAAGSAADIVRGGEPPMLPVTGEGEVARLTRAFNHMMRDLAMYCRLEKQLRHQEQLSAIGRVATRVAHDINNPLTVIKNVAALMKRERVLPPEMRADLDLIGRHCERCQRIVDNLLRFGRPLRLNLAEVELVGFMCGLMEGRGRSATTPYSLGHSRPAITVTADPVQLEQLFENLLDNAYEANRGREVAIQIDADEEQAEIRITDFGPGFARAEVDKAFELYYTTKANGTGLGLPNALAIARAHGGDIVISGPHRGEVTVRLRRGGPAGYPLQPARATISG